MANSTTKLLENSRNNPTNSVTLITEDRWEDGSGWQARVVLKGVMYTAHYHGTFLVQPSGAYKDPSRNRRSLAAVKKWAEERVATFPAEWVEDCVKMNAE